MTVAVSESGGEGTGSEGTGVASPEPSASLWRRSMSAIYDGVILFGIVMFFGYGFSALARFRAEDGLLRSTFQWYLFAVLGLYFVGFWSGGRRTLPMKTMSVALVNDADGRPVSLLRAAWRYVVASALFWGLLAFVWRHSPWLAILWPLPFLWAAWDKRRRTWYDIAAGTRLIHRDVLPARPPALPPAPPNGAADLPRDP